MANKQALDAVDALVRILGPGGPVVPQLTVLRDNMAGAVGAESEAVELHKQTKSLQNQIADLKAKATFAEKDYADRTYKAEATYKELLGALRKQESAKQAEIEALNAQANGLQSQIDTLKKELEKRTSAIQSSAAVQQREVEQKHAATMAIMKLEEDAARERVEGYKAELALLLKRVTG